VESVQRDRILAKHGLSEILSPVSVFAQCPDMIAAAVRQGWLQARILWSRMGYASISKSLWICGLCVVFVIATRAPPVNAEAVSTNINQQSLDIVGRGFRVSAVAAAFEKLSSSPSTDCHQNLCVRFKLGWNVFLMGEERPQRRAFFVEDSGRNGSQDHECHVTDETHRAGRCVSCVSM
jgi:hypothetical protein